MIEPYFESADGYFKLFQGDSVSLIQKVAAEVNMVFADPPYFLSGSGITCKSGKRQSVSKGKWDKPLGFEKELEFNKSWIKECKGVLKNNGTIWVSGTYHNIFSVGQAISELEFKILNDIVWEKPNPPPNLACKRFTHSTEIILWAAKSNKYTFNYADMKKANGGKQMKNVWKIKAPSKQEKQFGKHPTQKPEALLERIILASTKEGDLILDPFSGSGTTGIVAAKLKRRYIGIDLDKNYLDLTINRFEGNKV